MKTLTKIIIFLIGEEKAEYIIGDFREEFIDLVNRSGQLKAIILIIFEILKSIPAMFLFSIKKFLLVKEAKFMQRLES